MGAEDFYNEGQGKTAREAFRAVVDHAAYLHGHGGYSGTIAEKHDFVMINDTPAMVRNSAKAKAVQLRREAMRPDMEWEAKHLRQQADRLEAMANKVDDDAPAGVLARLLMAMDDPRVDDKWGPAGCIEIKTPAKKQGKAVDLDALLAQIEGTSERRFLFFGWASS